MHTNMEDIKCNGINIKWLNRATTIMHVLPQVYLFVEFSEREIPKYYWIVLDAEGMCINAHLDISNKELGHVVFIKKEEMGKFFNETTTKFCSHVLDKIYVIMV